MATFYSLKKKFLSLSLYSTSTLMQLRTGKLEKILDRLCATIVILRDQRCVQCGSREQLTNGHLFRRGHRVLRWDLKNCNCQCIYCNNRHEEYPEPYENWFIARYGFDSYEKLRRRIRDHTKLTKTERIEVYEDLVKAGKLILGGPNG